MPKMVAQVVGVYGWQRVPRDLDPSRSALLFYGGAAVGSLVSIPLLCKGGAAAVTPPVFGLVCVVSFVRPG